MAFISGNGGNNLLVGTSSDDDIWGMQGDDILIGSGGNDTLNGGPGNDTMDGGIGDDTYLVDSVDDEVVEYENNGTDSVRSSVTFSLNWTPYVENLTLTYSDDIDGYGNALDNTIYGNSGDNALKGAGGDDYLYGGGGDDYLDGGTGSDKMYGGTGNDYFVVDSIGDFVTEYAGQGTDTVASYVHQTLWANFENLTLKGSANIFGHGNELDNHITGNSGGNHIDGGLGADIMEGWSGNDTYEVDNEGDVVTEFTDHGYDTVKVAFDYQLDANVERLYLKGTGSITGEGNDLANDLYGNTGNNLIYGYDGNDDLDGGAGADFLHGGDGDDTYYVDHIYDQVFEDANEGTIDFVRSSVTFTLTDNVEKIILLDSGGAINATGGGDNNSMLGNASANTLDGGGGADYLEGRGGQDTLFGGNGDDYYIKGGADKDLMYGGAGADTFIFNGPADAPALGYGNTDYIPDFNQADGDKIDLNYIDAKPSMAGNQDFTFIGNGVSFSGTEGEVRFDTNYGLIEVDINGDAAADLQIEVDILSMNANDFIL